MRPLKSKQRGTALIITVGLLAVLAVIGFGFAVLARLQHDIANCYRAAAQNDLIAQAALQYAIGEIRFGWANAPADLPSGSDYWNVQTGAIANPVDGPRDPWFVDPSIAAQGYVTYDAAANKYYRHYCNLRCNSYALVHDDLGARLGVSIIKVLDSAGKLNINDQDGPVDAQGTPDTARLKGVLKQLLLKLFPVLSDAQADTFAGNILAARNTLTDKRFSSLEQLVARNATSPYDYKISGMDARVYEILKHYLTIYAWPHQLPVINSFPYVVNATGSGTLERKSSSQSTTPKSYYLRSPININTAAWELLYAVLMNIKYASTTGDLSITDADAIAQWIVRKRAGKDDPLNMVPGLTALTSSSTPTKAIWDGWTVTNSDTSKYRQAMDRRFEGWSGYPVGQFDSWGEVMDFLYNLVNDTTNDPFPLKITGAKAEAVLAATSPNAFAAGLAGYNAWHFGYPHLKQDPTIAAGAGLQQFARDEAADGNVPAPEVVGKNVLKAGGDAYPFCFSSLGRHEIYTRTYTFLKAEQGIVTTALDNTLTDTAKTWLSSPSQWRGYSVVIYEGKGKGQMRGIVYVKDDGADTGDGKGSTLVVDRWSVIPDTTSRYYIVGPGAFLDSSVTGGTGITTPADAGGKCYVLTDTTAKWENDQWNGHRVLFYRSSESGGVETVDDASVQERTIVDTIKGSSSGTLIVAPDLEPGIMDLTNSSKKTTYIILGCDGMVEHSGAFKAYDVIHHTTQDDFETNRATSPSSGSYTLAASGPNNYLTVDTSGNSSVVTGASASKVDGWLEARKRLVAPPAGATNPLLHNFNSATLAPDKIGGTDSGTCVASVPPAATWIGDALSAGGMQLSDGLHLTGGSVNYVDFRLTADLSNEGADGQEGGVVSLWVRPDEAFFSGTHKIVQIFGRSQANEEIALQVNGGFLELTIKFTTPSILFKAILPDSYGAGRAVNYNDGDYITRRYTASSVNLRTTWTPGEWHHVAFAWFELYDKDAVGTDDDPDHNANTLDDRLYAGDTYPNSVKDKGRLDEEVGCCLRMWIDGADQGKRTDVPAFNFASAASPAAMVRLSGDAQATVDGLVVYPLTGAAYKDLNLTFPAGVVRYDAYASYDTDGVPTGAKKSAEYVSPSISLSSAGSDTLTLGTVAWTSFFPWIRDGERWNGPDTKFPMQVQVSLGGKTSKAIPDDTLPVNKPMPAVFTGGALRDASDNPIEATSGSVQYKVYLYPCQGADSGDSKPGLLKGRQTPVLEDITITILGPVVFYYWQ